LEATELTQEEQQAHMLLLQSGLRRVGSDKSRKKPSEGADKVDVRMSNDGEAALHAELRERRAEPLATLQEIDGELVAAERSEAEASGSDSGESCHDKAGWTNGWGGCSGENDNPKYCTPTGWTCAGYEWKGWCGNGRVVTGYEWTAGAKYNNAKDACCACGGGSVPAVPLDPNCADVREFANSCPGWMQSGECERNPEWMSKSCMKSCDKCPKCEDQNPHCEAWAKQGECQKNADWMHANCEKSCKVCGGTCEDSHDGCEAWANTGECERNPDWMTQNCAKSCHECSGPAPTPEPAPHAPAKVSWHSMGKYVVNDEGEDVGTSQGSAEQCAQACDANPRCLSFTLCGAACHQKSADLTGFEKRTYNDFCGSYFKAAGNYFPENQALTHPSTAPLMSFYVYRAESPPPYYPQENTNEASIGGVLWYLHNECIFTCKGEGFMSNTGKWGDRKFGRDRIRRFKLTMKATQPLLDKGMHFSVLKSFDSGENTGPHRGESRWGPGTGPLSVPEWNEFGFTVGCGIIGEFPHQDWSSGKAYENCIWYSLPGACPTMNYKVGDDKCKDEFPGGLCEAATGQGNCTYSYEDAGFIMIDELVGITPRWKDRAEFCSKCKTEGSADGPGGCGLDFWGKNIWDKAANQRQAEKALEMFDRKFPTMPKAHNLQPPRCDFNQHKFGF